MLRNQQNISQKQQLGQQQKLSPQQLQFIKLLQLPTIALEQRIKEELELNPILEKAETDEIQLERLDIEDDKPQSEEKEEGLETLEEHEVDWDEYDSNTEFEGESYSTPTHPDMQEWQDLPDPYHASLLEELENQVALLDLTDEEELIADQILGSLDEDGYFRRDLEAVADNIAFNHSVYIEVEDVERIRKQIQLLDPIGIASTSLQDCLLVQIEQTEKDLKGKNLAINIVKDAWDAFQKKHFKKLTQKFDVSEDELKEAFNVIKGMDPRPGSVGTDMEESQNYIEPDFEVYWRNTDEADFEKGEFLINLNQRNNPSLRISPDYKQMWDDIKEKTEKPDQQTQNFIKGKIDSANWFIESIKQRQNTLMNVVKTMVALQEDFFKYGDSLKPMILKDIAERIGMDISTISRVVNGKYVQTNFGVYELKYFFNEALETESGEEVSNREVKNSLQDIIDNEDKRNPLSDQHLAEKLNELGYKVARRTVSKYREQLNEPVARLRKQI